MKPIHISVAEPVRLLQARYREYVIARLQNHNGRSPLPFKSVELDCVPFMTALLDEMFGNASNLDRFGEIPQSTRILHQAGFDAESATYIAAEIFRFTVDAISVHLPDASFGNADGYQYGFCGDCDVMITPPLQYQD